MILTEIQIGLVGKVKQEQINLKKKAKNERKDLLDELDKLNKELLQTCLLSCKVPSSNETVVGFHVF